MSRWGATHLLFKYNKKIATEKSKYTKTNKYDLSRAMYIVEVKDLKGTRYYRARTKYEAERYKAKTPKLVKIITPHEFISLLELLPVDDDELYLL